MKHLSIGWIALLFPAFFLFSCNGGREMQQATAKQTFAECATHAVEGKEWVSFSVDKVISGYPKHISFHLSPTDSAVYYISHDSMEIWRMAKDEIAIVNLEDRDLFTFGKESDKYLDRMALFENRAAGIGNYYQAACRGTLAGFGKIEMTSEADTVVGKTPVKSFLGKGNVYSLYDGTTRQLKYKYVKMYRYWIDGRTFQIDSVVTSECRLDSIGRPQEETNEEAYRLSGFSYASRSSYFDSVFDFSSARYDGFSRHDENNYVYVSLNDSVVSEAARRLPLVGLGGDTTCIAGEKGWLLLDLWSFNCKPCMEHLLDMAAEKETLGSRKIEQAGIKVLAINYFSDNMDLIGQVANKTASRDIVCSGKRLNTQLYVPTLGYCYLLAPNKEIVYKGNYDYLQIIEAKANYEKEHKNK